MADRAVSPLVGFVALVGMVVVVAVALLLVGGSLLSDAESSTQVRQVEQSMSDLARSSERLAATETSSASYRIDGVESGSPSLDRSAGHVEFHLVTANGTTETVFSRDLGAYRYELADGTEVAFQGGGVWRRQDGWSSLVSPPAFQFQRGPDPTLTFPVVRFGNETASGPTGSSGSLQVDDRREITYEGRTNPIEARGLYVDVRSRYCEAWARHVADATDAAVAESCAEQNQTSSADELRVAFDGPPASAAGSTNESADGGNDTSTGVATGNGTFDHGIYSESGIAVSSGYLDINATIGTGGGFDVQPSATVAHDGDVQEGLGPLRAPHDDEIAALLDAANASDWEGLCGGNEWDYSCEYQGGQTVYVDDFASGAGEVTFDLSAGNLTLVVDDDVQFGSSTTWKLENYEDKHVQVYTTGDLVFDGYTSIGPDGGPSSFSPTGDPPAPSDTYPSGFQFYAPSDAEITVTATAQVEGTISAPSAGTGNTSTTSVQGHSGFLQLVGSIYAGEVSLTDGTFDVYRPPAPGTIDGPSNGTDDSGADDDTDESTDDGSGDDSATGTDGSVDSETELYYLHLSEVELDLE